MPTVQSILAAEMRRMLVSDAKALDYSNPTVAREVEEIDLPKLTDRINRLATRAAVLVHAVEVMEQKVHAHPLAAFVHAIECVDSDASDHEFEKLIAIWGRIVADCLTPAPKAVETLKPANVSSMSTPFLKQVHRTLPHGELRAAVASELLRRQMDIDADTAGV